MSRKALAPGRTEVRWMLPIHQIPAAPAYLRVKIGRQLHRIGAVAIKNSVDVLPRDDEPQEHFQWVLREVVEGLLPGMEAQMRTVEGTEPSNPPLDVTQHRGRTWVTRTGIKVDRMASAWLILKFIDPAARFKFVPAKGYRPEPGELRFDMFESEFTHEGELCTFEVLIQRFGLHDPALRAIAEIVHDIDVKDAKYGREEAPGIGQLVVGIAAAHPADDEARLARGRALFEDLYAAHASTKHGR